MLSSHLLTTEKLYHMLYLMKCRKLRRIHYHYYGISSLVINEHYSITQHIYNITKNYRPTYYMESFTKICRNLVSYLKTTFVLHKKILTSAVKNHNLCVRMFGIYFLT